MANVLSISDLNTTVDAEPRILDVLLGERLGFERPRVIRELIERNAAEVDGYGGLPQITANPGTQGGRPSKAYYLNEPQSLLICMFSNTAKAAEVRRELITVFMEYRNGKPVPAADPLARVADMLDIHDKSEKLASVSVMLAGLQRDHDKFTRGLQSCVGAIRDMVALVPPTPPATPRAVGRPSSRDQFSDRIFAVPVEQAAIEAGVSTKTIYRWRALASNDNKAA